MCACLFAGLLWLDSSVSEITQKQWSSKITQKQWFSLNLVFVCLLACWWMCLTRRHATYRIGGLSHLIETMMQRDVEFYLIYSWLHQRSGEELLTDWQLFSGQAVQGAWGGHKTVCTGRVHNPLFVKVCPYQVGQAESVIGIHKGFLPHIFVGIWLSGFVHPWPLSSYLISMSCSRVKTARQDDGDGDCLLQNVLTAEHVLETETAGISCQFRSSHSSYIRLAISGDIQLRSMKLVHPAAFQRSTRGIVPPAAIGTGSSQDRRVLQIYWLKRGSHFTHWIK